MRKRKIIVDQPIMCRDQRLDQLQTICYIIGYWVNIDGEDVSITLDEFRVLSSFNAEIEQSSDFDKNLEKYNVNPQFVFEWKNDECKLKCNDNFSLTHYRIPVINTILSFLNITSCEICDLLTSWPSIDSFIDSEQKKSMKQTELYMKTIKDYRYFAISDFLKSTLSSDEVDSVLKRESRCTIELDPNGWMNVYTTSIPKK